MFKSQSKYKRFKFSILIEDILSPFINLISDFLSIDGTPNWDIITAIDFSSLDSDFASKIAELKSNYPSNNEIEDEDKFIYEVESLKREANAILNNHFSKIIFSKENLESYEKSIILIDKTNKYIISNKDIANILKSILRNSNMVKELLNIVHKNKDINFDNLISFDNESLYNKDYITAEEISIVCPAINVSYLDLNNENNSILKTPIEKDDFWVNEKFFKDYSLPEDFDASQDDFLLEKGEKTIGLNCGNVCFIYDSNPFELVNPADRLNYYWMQLKNRIYYTSSTSNHISHSMLVQSFNHDAKSEGFSPLLSKLKKNLYIEEAVDSKYKKYFEKAFIIKGLKHLQEYELYLPFENDSKQSLIGLYHLDKKPSEKHYNLVHWISNDGDTSKILEFSDVTPVKKNKNPIHVLKPEISFYFRHRFFEDFFESVMKDLGLEYLNNYKIQFKSNEQEAEFDFMIKTENKIYIVELKTKLRGEEISKFEKKCSRLMDEIEYLSDYFEFLIIGALSDENCKSYKHHINEGKKEHPGYNDIRDGFSTIPYWFEFPIEGSIKRLTCIAEPSYEKLKSIIIDICK